MQYIQSHHIRIYPIHLYNLIPPIIHLIPPILLIYTMQTFLKTGLYIDIVAVLDRIGPYDQTTVRSYYYTLLTATKNRL